MNPFAQVSPSCRIPGLAEIYSEHFPGLSTGTFVEVGGYDGYTYSNTWGLAQIGWRGVCFEPVPERAAQCRDRYINTQVRVIQACAGVVDGVATLYVGAGPATINQETVKTQAFGYGYSEEETIQARVVRLDSELPRHDVRPGFEVISIDVEGAEIEVLSGFDLTYWRPRMIIAETCEKHPDPKFRFHYAEINGWILNYGYKKIYTDHINSIYVI